MAIDHHAAAQALDLVRQAAEAEGLAREETTRAIRTARAIPGVTMSQIATALGLSRRTLYARLHRYQSAEDLTS